MAQGVRLQWRHLVGRCLAVGEGGQQQSEPGALDPPRFPPAVSPAPDGPPSGSD
jgi:hypothetical protein